MAGITGEYRVRCLDKTNAESAMLDPEDFLREDGKPIRLDGEGINLEIKPFGVVLLNHLGE